jgi:hypothetical protein
MEIQGLTEPCGVEFIQTLGLKPQKKALQGDKVLAEIMGELAAEGRTWVKVKEIRERLLASRSLDWDLRTVGRVLTALGYGKRLNPDAEYLATKETKVTKVENSTLGPQEA